MVGINNTADQWWAVSITLLTNGGHCQWQRCYWYRVAMLTPLTSLTKWWRYLKKPIGGSVIDTAHQWSAVSLTLPTIGHRCHWHCLPLVRGVIDTAHHWSSAPKFCITICLTEQVMKIPEKTVWWAVPLIPLTSGQRCLWHRPPAVIDSGGHKIGDWKVDFLGKYESIFGKALTCVQYQGSRRSCLIEKNQGSKISWHSPFKNVFDVVVQIFYVHGIRVASCDI
jgi:hypothetical protein